MTFIIILLLCVMSLALSSCSEDVSGSRSEADTLKQENLIPRAVRGHDVSVSTKQEILPPAYCENLYPPPKLCLEAGEILAELYPFRDSDSELWGYTDANGSIIIQPQFRAAHDFSEGLAFASKIIDGEVQRGYIDTSGNLVIILPPENWTARPFSYGFALVGNRVWNRREETPTNTAYGPFIFIDRTGENAFSIEFSSANVFREGFAVVVTRDRGWTFINTSGEIAFDIDFSHVHSFFDGLAIVQFLNNNVAFIDTTGNNAFGMEFLIAEHFDVHEVGYARVMLLDETLTYIDREGNIHLDRTWYW